MPKCPACGAEIKHLEEEKEELTIWKVYLSPDGERLEFKLIGSETLEEADEFSCPKCGEIIAHSVHDAIRFLKGENKVR